MVELDGDVLVVIRYKVDDLIDRFYLDHEVHDEYETTYYYTRNFKFISLIIVEMRIVVVLMLKIWVNIWYLLVITLP